jgi:uncharacterized repeat protein (TIGR01451 family)
LVALVAAHPALAQNFSVDDVTINEGAAPGTTIFTFTITRDVTAGAASVDFATGDVTAIAGVDYVAVLTTTVNFADTVGSMPAQVTVNGDATVELNETFNVLLSNPQGTGVPGIADGLGVGTITNDDAATLGRLAGFQVTEGNAGTTPATFTVTLSAPVDVDVTVDIATEDLAATLADNDYVFMQGTVTFPAGTTTSQTFDAPVNGDVKLEFNQRFQTRISNVQAQNRNVTIFDELQTANIINDDLGRIAINDVPLNEGTGAGTTAFTFNVQLLDAAEITPGPFITGQLRVDAATANGTATTADNDYAAAGPTSLTFAGTQGEIQNFVVQATRDAKVELNETFEANLSNLVVPTCTPQPACGTLNVVISDSQGIGTITNDDSATLSIDNVSASETNTGSNPTFTFTATLSAQVDVPVNVDFATGNGTATTADGDYAATSGTLNFTATTPGQTRTLQVTVNGDDKVELDESFLVSLSNIQASGRSVTFGANPAFGTIVNDETATLSINDVTLAEGGPSGTTQFNFTVSLDRQLANSISVDVDAVDDTATSADSDFAAATPPTLNFAGAQNENIGVSVNVNGDSNAEIDEVFHVVLSNLQAGNLAVSFADQGVGTILNDDVMDLSITKDDSGATSFPSGPISYQLSFNNLGAKTARGVVLTDVVPNSTTFNPGGSSVGWACTPNNNPGSTCTLNVGSVAAGGSGSRTFALTVDASPTIPLTISNTASISDETGGVADTSLSNNSDTDTTLVVESVATDFFSLDPCRVLDTRDPDGPLGGPALAGGSGRVFTVVGTCGIPSTAKAISVNIAVTGATAGGNVRLHPGGTPVPAISSLNYLPGQTRSNNAIVELNGSGELAVFAAQATGTTVHFILDVNGYFE